MQTRDLQLLLLIVAHPPVQVKLFAFSYFRNVLVRLRIIVAAASLSLTPPRAARQSG